MEQATAKQKIDGNEVGATNCVNPTMGEEMVAAYIVGDLTENAHRDFVSHVGECRYCLEQIVLRGLAEEKAEEKSQAPQQQSAHSARG